MYTRSNAMHNIHYPDMLTCHVESFNIIILVIHTKTGKLSSVRIVYVRIKYIFPSFFIFVYEEVKM